jgi:hypothetical protein
MIIKELDRIETTDKFEQAGYRAESQLAEYSLPSQRIGKGTKEKM